jgi:hypothetical protein
LALGESRLSFTPRMRLNGKKKQKHPQEYEKLAKRKWLQIMNEDKEIQKWYKKFLIEAEKSKKEEYDAVDTYKKEGMSGKFST